MLEKLDDVLFSKDDIDLDDIDSDIVTFFSDDMGFNVTDLNNIDLDDDNCDDNDDPETIIQVRVVAWCNRYKPMQGMLKRDK